MLDKLSELSSILRLSLSIFSPSPEIEDRALNLTAPQLVGRATLLLSPALSHEIESWHPPADNQRFLLNLLSFFQVYWKRHLPASGRWSAEHSSELVVLLFHSRGEIKVVLLGESAQFYPNSLWYFGLGNSSKEPRLRIVRWRGLPPTL